MEYDPADFAAFQRLYQSVSKLPEIVTSDREFSAAMQSYTPTGVEEGRHVRVLLSIAISAAGEIESVRAVQPDLPPGMHAIAMHTNEAGEVIGQAPSVTADPEIVAAAEAIGRTLRFRPAEKDGVPVAFADYRMSIEFGGRSAQDRSGSDAE